MTFIVLSFVAGALTILSPCILPVVPFVFTSAGRPFLQSGFPVLIGLAVSFAAIASLASVGGAWAVQVNEAARWLSLVILGLLGVALVFPRVAVRAMAPVVALGEKLARAAQVEPGSRSTGVARSVLIGVATGLLWAPCAGPVLGLVLTASVLQGTSAYGTGLLFAYAAGAGTSLALVLCAGSRAFRLMKVSLRGADVARRLLGSSVLAGVVVIAMGWDTGVLARLAQWDSSSRIEQMMLDALQPSTAQPHPTPSRLPSGAPEAGRFQPVGFERTGADATKDALSLPVEGSMPELTGITGWLGSPPLDRASLRGKVVLVDFWTFACINCQNALPYVQRWHEKYKDQGFVVVGVHSPEFAFERNPDNVRRAAEKMGLTFPIALDNGFHVWRAFSNRYWPAHYFIDAEGRIRFHHFGEGEYERSEEVIRQLLKEARTPAKDPAPRAPARPTT